MTTKDEVVTAIAPRPGIKYDGVSVGDEVQIIKGATSSYIVKKYAGLKGMVSGRNDKGVAVDLGKGTLILVSRADVVRV